MSGVRPVRLTGGMRILFTSHPAYGHVHPMLPLARAARDAGHLVRFATGPDVLAEAERHGLDGEVAGPTSATIRARASALHGPWDHLDAVRQQSFGGAAILGAPVPERLADLEAIAADFQPHLVVHDVLELAGHLLARRHGIPAMAHGMAPLYPATTPLIADALQAVAELVPGSAPSYDDYLGTPYLDIAPPSLAPVGPMRWRHRIPLRPSSGMGDPRSLAPAIEALPFMRSVLLTFGTIVDRSGDLLRQAVAALDDLPVNLVVATGPRLSPDVLGEQPPHVLVEDFLPHGAILPLCDVLVSQGGAGGLLGALRHGLPQVVVPQAADQFWNAAALTRAGAGVTVLPYSESALRDAVCTALDDPFLAHAAEALRAETERMPGPERIVPLLEAFASGEESPALAG